MIKPTNRTTRAVMTAVASAAVLCMAVPELAHAQAQAQAGSQARRYDWNIPAQPLSRSVSVVTETAGIQLFYNDDDGRGRVRAPAVRGRYTVDEVLARLTAGTGLTYRYLSPGVVTLEPAPRQVTMEEDGSRVLGPVRVEGAQSSYGGGPTRGDGIAQLGGVRGGQDEEANGYRANVATVGTGAPTALEDIPRSVSVLTQEQLQKQDIQDIGDALRRLPGVTLVESNSSDLSTGAEVYSRGFRLTQLQVDGGAPRALNIIGNGMLGLGAYERVELVRGANGAFSGSNSPGGSLNLVRKRPGTEESLEITAGLGSFDRMSLQADYSTPSLSGTALAFRGVLSVEDQSYFYDNASKLNGLIYGVLDAPLGERARVELGLQHTHIEATAPYSGRYRYLDGPLIDFGGYYANLTPEWAYDDVSRTEVFSRLYVELLEDLDLEVGFDYEFGDEARQQLTNSISFVSNQDTAYGYSAISAYKQEYGTSNFSLNFRLTGQAETFGLKHNYYIGGDLTEAATTVGGIRYVVASEVFTSFAELKAALGDYSPVLAPIPNVADPLGSSSRRGVVIGDVISWRDKIELTLAVRRYDSEVSLFNVTRNSDTGLVEGATLGEAFSGEQRADPEWTPTWAIAFKPTENINLYGTQAEGDEEVITPRFTEDGAVLPPISYQNREGGVKIAYEGWLLTLAGYSQKQANVPIPLYGTICPPSNSFFTPCHAPGGASQESKGFDVEVAGEILPGLSVVANYNYSETETRGTGVNFLTTSPTNAAQLFIDWSPTFWPRTSLRGGLRYRSEVSSTGYVYVFDPITNEITAVVPSDFTEEPYLVFDFGLQHQLTDKISLDLYVENLTDEQYLSTISGSSSNFPGAPRTFTATLRWKPALNWMPGPSNGGMAPFGDPADWYASVDFGVHASDDLDATASGLAQDGVTPVDWTFTTEDGIAASARVGYRFAPRVRGEIEGSYRAAQIGAIGGNAVAPFGVCDASFSQIGRPFDCTSVPGAADNWSLMANVLYDFGSEGSRFRPYVGGGIGVARMSVDFSGKMDGIGGADPWGFNTDRLLQEVVAGDSTTIAFAYQAIAGVSFKLTDRATLDATYRFYVAPEVTWDTYNLDGPAGYDPSNPTMPLTPRLGEFRAPYQDHSLMIGLRWAFGAR